MKWPSISFSELFRVKHGYAFKGQYFESDGPFVLLTPGNFCEEGGYRDQGDKQKFYTGDVPEAFILDQGDVLVAMTEQSHGLLGSSVWIPTSNRLLHNQRLGRIVDLDETRLNKRFLYYLFNTRDVRHQIAASASGTKVRHTAPDRIGQVVVNLPPPKVQCRIADVLSAYDDLMENNRRRMALLEEAARQLYREWFVRLRFPGREHTRVTDGVPEGWERVPAPEAIGINPRTPLSDELEHWWVQMADLPTDSMVIQNAVKREGRGGSKFRNRDTLFARITPCLENGKTGFVNFMAEGEVGRGSTEFIVLRSKRLTPEFVYCLARTYDFRENAIKSMVGSSGRQRVQESCFQEFLVLVPSRRVLTLFAESVEPLFQQIKVLHLQNQKLRAARDLLPRLMSGEVAV
ncbi:MAG: restriction endonuclease subunit S [Pirellulaceae bacterium]|nr:restriction endonuclease subunit S [Pirellulaceae bacterium]